MFCSDIVFSRAKLKRDISTRAGILISAALKIDPGYPVAQIDMVYFDPPLQLVNKNRQPGALANQAILGKNWQRWSRHRTGHNPWRPGLDDISTHLLLVENWLERELNL